jgi:hypothetical protein
MTEAEWLALAEPEPMLEYLRNKVSDRQLRLLALACCRNAWGRVPHGQLVLDEAEQHMESTVDWLAWNRRTAETSWASFERHPIAGIGHPREVISCLTKEARMHKSRAGEIVQREDDVPTARTTWAQTALARAGQKSLQLVLIGEILGNPFRPLPPPPEAIAPLAERIYAGEWELMPILGEWLQEHGYWSEGEHCLDPHNQHVKGCRVVDWVAGRE